MKRSFIYCLIFVGFLIFTTACCSEKSLILFNKSPISRETVFSQSNTNVFSPNERIYYLITLPKSVQTKMLLIQVYSSGSGEVERLGYDLVWARRAKVRTEQINYYTDYLVLSSPGAYVMNVYSRDNPNKLLTSANFYVKNS